MNAPRVIILGGGFGGVQCARELRRELSTQVELVLFNRENHLVFSPMLAEVVGSSINALDVIVPLRQMLPRIFSRTEEVREIDLAANAIEFEAEDGQWARMQYDQLVIACGSTTNLNIVPGMADHAFPLKTIGDAARLRSHIMEQMEKAEVAATAERRRWHLTFLIVGGGYSGVEAAGEINDLVRDSARYFHNWKADEVKVLLIHVRDQVLPEISPGLREFARTKMELAGVQMELKARVTSATPEGVGLADGRFFKGATIVCTIGTSPALVITGLNSPKEKGRLLTEPDMRLRGSANVWAVGDCAIITNSYDGQPSPTTGQFAERQGRQCARNIVRVLKGKPTKPFRFKQLGELCSIGGHSAVADLFGMHLSGFLAWFAWRGIYLFKLPTLGRRLQVGFDWATLLVFRRDLAHIRMEQTDRVCHSHYDPGEFIFQRGDPPSNFYVLEQGEVEVLRGHNGEGEVASVLGPGSFFGERLLLGARARMTSIRARTPVEVLVMGKNLFTQMSSALAPLREALAKTLNTRSADPWKDEPRVHDLFRRTPLRALLEPVPQPLLQPSATLREVGHAFVRHGNEFFFVSSDGQTLEGMVTVTNLLGTWGGGANAQTPLREFMTPNPVTIALDNNCAVAAETMREYRLKSLPVVERTDSRKLAGCIRVRRLMAFVFTEPQRGDASTPVRT